MSSDTTRTVFLKLLLIMLLYPVLTLATSIAVGQYLGQDLVQSLLRGLSLVAYSLLGLIPGLGPLVYASVVLLDREEVDLWVVPEILGLIAAITFCVISTRAVLDLLRSVRRGRAYQLCY